MASAAKPLQSDALVFWGVVRVKAKASDALVFWGVVSVKAKAQTPPKEWRLKIPWQCACQMVDVMGS